MKMTIEEKAKAYDEALERAKELLEIGVKDTRDKRVVLSFFPELKESEDDRIKKKIIATIHLYYGEPLEDEAKEMIYWLEKQGEQTAEWSKEDKRNFDIIYGIIYNSCNAEDASRLIAWLKSLKERVQPQPKQEWSKEDKERIEQICDDLKCGMINFYANEVVKGLHYKEIIESNIEWLKSLRLQKQWKPSDEQLDSLYDVLNPCDGFNREVLESLYVQLKKLREE